MTNRLPGEREGRGGAISGRKGRTNRLPDARGKRGKSRAKDLLSSERVKTYRGPEKKGKGNQNRTFTKLSRKDRVDCPGTIKKKEKIPALEEGIFLLTRKNKKRRDCLAQHPTTRGRQGERTGKKKKERTELPATDPRKRKLPPCN